MSEDKFFKSIIDAGDLLRNPQQFKHTIQTKIVIISGAWHTFAYQRGPIVDSYYTPAGYMTGSIIHANYIEALLDRRVYRPMANRVADGIEFILVLLTVLVFAMEGGAARKSIALLGLTLACIGTSYIAFTNFGIFFDFFIPLVAVAMHAGLEQILEWRDLAHEAVKNESSRPRVSKSIVTFLMLGVFLFGPAFGPKGYALDANTLRQSQSDSADPNKKDSDKNTAPNEGKKQPKPPIDPNKPGGPRVTYQGVIKERSGNTMTLQTTDTPHLVVVLNDQTQVEQAAEVFKARKKEMSMAALIPGLTIKVEGTYNAQNQLVATSVKFKAEDLEQAQAIEAGLHETQVKAAANQAELERQAAALAAQNAALKEQQAAITAQQKEIAANKAKIAASSARFGELDQYYILDEVTVLFGNGVTKVDPKYNAQLLALVQKAMTYKGYNIQVKGYASSVGSAALNQQLSEERANNVTNILVQQAHVPLTNMLAPGAMGESRQVGNDKTAEGQAENRRVIVRALLNKGIAGTELPLPTTK